MFPLKMFPPIPLSWGAPETPHSLDLRTLGGRLAPRRQGRGPAARGSLRAPPSATSPKTRRRTGRGGGGARTVMRPARPSPCPRTRSASRVRHGILPLHSPAYIYIYTMVVGLNPKICARRIPDLSASLSLCSAVARPGGFLCAAPLAQLRAGALAETRMFAGPTEGSSRAVVCLLCGGAWRAPSVPLLVLALAARHALWSKPRPEWLPERLYLPSTLVSFRALRPYMYAASSLGAIDASLKHAAAGQTTGRSRGGPPRTAANLLAG
eukprot:COSAG06_NODE_1651_length_8804_cov_4.320620_4_plen_267_part_00